MINIIPSPFVVASPHVTPPPKPLRSPPGRDVHIWTPWISGPPQGCSGANVKRLSGLSMPLCICIEMVFVWCIHASLGGRTRICHKVFSLSSADDVISSRGLINYQGSRFYHRAPSLDCNSVDMDPLRSPAFPRDVVQFVVFFVLGVYRAMMYV
jgi:hypothetical protein